MPVTKCPLCARPRRAGETVRPGLGDIIPQGSKDSRRVPAVPANWVRSAQVRPKEG